MKNGRCPKCDHTAIVKSKAADYGGDNREYEMSVTAEPRMVFPGRNPRYPHGVLHTYTCRSCGFTEWYAENPESIPIGSDFATELIPFGGEVD